MKDKIIISSFLSNVKEHKSISEACKRVHEELSQKGIITDIQKASCYVSDGSKKLGIAEIIDFLVKEKILDPKSGKYIETNDGGIT